MDHLSEVERGSVPHFPWRSADAPQVDVERRYRSLKRIYQASLCHSAFNYIFVENAGMLSK
jgi:hypothetical protein